MSETSIADTISILKTVIEGTNRLLNQAIGILENMPHQEQIAPQPSKSPLNIGAMLQKAGLSPSLFEVREDGNRVALLFSPKWYEDEKTREDWERVNKTLFGLGFQYVKAADGVRAHWIKR